jgi:cell division initiation protein
MLTGSAGGYERVKPTDLERTGTHLRRAWRGFDRTQVLEVMQKAALEMSALRGEIESLQQQLTAQKAEVETYRAQENTLKEALLLAQRAADDTRTNARREGDQLIEDARRKALEIEQQAQREMNELRWELECLRLEKHKFLSSFRTLLETQLRELTEMSGCAVVEEAVDEDVAKA